ncbi:MFS transporter [Nakamurella deserti]|uniref:MFS transporter n=1 Tax=Nakamurella deserti TaxID=2164074 RepID=UPI00197BC979|nr:MFS transporter [Nakamurella deserti]
MLALFAFDGFVFGTWAARVPDLSASLHLSAAALGAVLLCVSFGALATMQLAGRWCTRYGAGAVGVAGGILLGLSLVLPGLAGSPVELGAALLVFGGATGAVNVAANSLGVRLEQARRRPLMPMLHAGVSFGALAGAVVGGGLAIVVGVLPHLVLVGAAGIAVTCAVARPLAAVDPLPPESARRPTARRGRRDAGAGPAVPHRLIVVLLGAVAGCTAFAEGTLTDWAALHLRTGLGAGPVVAAAGFAGFSLAMGIGRLGGGWALRRFGARRLVVRGAALAAGAMLVAALTPSVPVALLGFLLVGFGLANVFPVALAAAGSLGGPQGVALAATVGYTGLLGGPPLVGVVAEHLGLPVALTAVALFIACIALLALTVRTLSAGAGTPVLADGPAGSGWSVATVAGWRRAVSGGLAGYVTDLQVLQRP